MLDLSVAVVKLNAAPVNSVQEVSCLAIMARRLMARPVAVALH